MLPHFREIVDDHFREIDEMKQNMTNNTKSKSKHNGTSTALNGGDKTTTDSKVAQIKGSKPKSDSVFAVLAGRIASLELGLTKQQVEVAELLDFDLKQEIEAVKNDLTQFQLNLTQHIAFQTYGISLVMKTVLNDSAAADKIKQNEWADAQQSYYRQQKVESSERRDEQMERIQMNIEDLMVMQTNLYIIGLVIMAMQLLLIIGAVIYIFCRGKKDGKLWRTPTSSVWSSLNSMNSRGSGSSIRSSGIKRRFSFSGSRSSKNNRHRRRFR